MPFTFSHPAAILPLRSRWAQWLSFPALVVGSMVPDAGYYLPLLPDRYRVNAHTAIGAVTFSVPVGLVILLIVYLMAPELVFLLPSPHREALRSRVKTPAFSLRAILSAVCSIAIGAETHVFLDSFTHEPGWGVRHIAWLRRPFWGARHGFDLLQWLLSFVGLAIVLIAYNRRLRSEGFNLWVLRKPSWRTFLWLAVLAGCLVDALFQARVTPGVFTSFFVMGHRHSAFVLVTTFVTDTLITVCAVAVAAKLFRPQTRVAC